MSKIEWTEKTWNPITGCTKVSAGCKNCYAEVIAKRFWGARKFSDIQFHEERVSEPILRKKPTKYFVNSMSDLFHEEVYEIEIGKIFNVMGICKQHVFQVLTKRPMRMNLITNSYYKTTKQEPFNNVWLGISVENQYTANERMKYLRETNSKIKWVSYEPALTEVDWTGYEFIDWIVVGGESGQKKRPHEIEWFRKTRDWAKKNNIPFFMKQLDKIAQIPEDLMIREYPVQFSI